MVLTAILFESFKYATTVYNIIIVSHVKILYVVSRCFPLLIGQFYSTDYLILTIKHLCRRIDRIHVQSVRCLNTIWLSYNGNSIWIICVLSMKSVFSWSTLLERRRGGDILFHKASNWSKCCDWAIAASSGPRLT